MFQEWDFLLAEIWVLLLLAAVVGLIAGWLIWGGRSDTGADADEIRRLQTALDHEKARGRALISDPLDDIPAMQGGGYMRPIPPVPPTGPSIELEPRTLVPSDEPADTGASPHATAAAIPTSLPPAASRNRPLGLDGARDGLPDDLTKIKGIGPKLEKLCHNLGFWHYDQIATWTTDEIAWVDENLEGFKGRVTRDTWVAQAKDLAANRSPAFAHRND